MTPQAASQPHPPDGTEAKEASAAAVYPRRFSPRTASIYFLGVLLAVTLKATYDRFFEGISAIDSLAQAWTSLAQRPARTVLFLFQFIVYLFTLLRFYFGAYRYLRIEPAIETVREILVDVVSLIILFTGLYITGISIRTTYLFYYLIFLFHLFDLCWFWLAHLLLKIKGAVQRVIFIWIIFDVLTMLAFLILKLSDWAYPQDNYLYQFIASWFLLGIGIVDFIKLWPFYTDKDNWESQLLAKKGRQ